ncbi:zinc ribbon domain-containing protein [Bacillus lacus]|uniref:Zinc ribbon domain-containing protein n=1 Tax=Metabacillus lacus TaxID=1983721 RepID=A0A7X2J003_9BACI|nr:zinc ribbon domain-containing protein [Metabacillus lacus]MRX72835.1 zinc ribbon domain-containing protein [Metabacillus lacus]
MKQCNNCNHENEEEGKFCENCGIPLGGTVIQEVAATAEGAPSPVNQQASQYIEEAKKISKMYFSYFLEVLKKPYSSSVNVGKEHFLNGIITIALFSVLIPLITYFGLKGVLSDLNFLGEELNIKPPFTDIVLKPTFAYAIFVFLVAVFTFVSIKLGRVNISFQEVTARFGSFLIPAVALLGLGLIMSILKIKLFVFFVFLGFITAAFLVPPLVIASFKKQSQEGVDVIYGSLLTYFLTFIAMLIMGDMLFEVLKNFVQKSIGTGLF